MIKQQLMANSGAWHCALWWRLTVAACCLKPRCETCVTDAWR